MNITNTVSTLPPAQSLPKSSRTTPVASAALNSPDISAEAREKLAAHVSRQQQQALLETAKNAFAPTEEESSATMITGEIAQTAAKKQTQQALAFMAIDKLSEKAAQRPHIQIQA